MGKFYQRLNYSLGNEDWKTEEAALKISKTDRVLCITASGDRPLNLLSLPCREIISVDANFSQNALCELKKEALSHLDYDQYLGFLGLKKQENRLSSFHKLKRKMNKSAVSFWEKESKKIEEGVLFQGMVEKLIISASHFIRLLAKSSIEELFITENVEKQKTFIEEKWNYKAWQRVFRLVLNPFFTRFLLKDPGLYYNLGYPQKPADYIYTRLEKSLMAFPVKENIIVSLLFQGKLFKEGYSPYLTEKGTEEIRKNLHRLTTVTADVISYLESAKENSIDCFSLSDIASYMDEKAFHRLIRAVVRTARPNARFCLRECMSMQSFPMEYNHHFERDEKLERELEEKDRCFLYRFKVGKICK